MAAAQAETLNSFVFNFASTSSQLQRRLVYALVGLPPVRFPLPASHPRCCCTAHAAPLQLPRRCTRQLHAGIGHVQRALAVLPLHTVNVHMLLHA